MLLRAMTRDEVGLVRRLAHSRTAPTRTVERARIIWLARSGVGVLQIAETLHIHPSTVRVWIQRFNEQGLAGLPDRPRPGRPAAYTDREVSEAIDAALAQPQELGLPFTTWTLDRLVMYLNNQRGIGIRRSRLWEVLLTEGIVWHRPLPVDDGMGMRPTLAAAESSRLPGGSGSTHELGD